MQGPSYEDLHDGVELIMSDLFIVDTPEIVSTLKISMSCELVVDNSFDQIYSFNYRLLEL